MEPHTVVSRDEWIAARKRHLVHEKELTRMGEQLAAERRALPWVKIDKPYLFETPQGLRRLADLFGHNSQLVIYHFMMGPDDAEGCASCSFVVDHLQGAVVHLKHHDVSVVLASRAPLSSIVRYQQRMGWFVPWVSSQGSEFNRDFGVFFTPEEVASGHVDYNYHRIVPWGEDAHGLSVFFKDDAGQVFHTYSTYARGAEPLLGTYVVLDITPKGRNEPGPPPGMQHWLKRHDQYTDTQPAPHACCA